MARKPAQERFEYHVHFEPNSGCWLWAGPMNLKYGIVGKILAHRFSYMKAGGVIPDGMDLCHRCDTPLCVNPDHLFPGSRAENIQDAVRKGRMTNLNGNRHFGERHHNSKLTVEAVRAIRDDPRTPYKIARDYGVADFTVYSIKRRLTWRHVE